MSAPDTQAWARAADAHALGEGPAPGPAPSEAGRREEELFAGVVGLAAPISMPGDASLVDGILETFAANGSSSSPTPHSAVGKIAAGVGATALLVAIGLATRPEPRAADPLVTSVAQQEPRRDGQMPLARTTQAAASAGEAVVKHAAPPTTLTTPAAKTDLNAALAADSSRKVAPKQKQKQKQPQLSPAQLLARARAKRGAGDSSAAQDLYGRLVREYPKSPEAHASRISLGQLQLSVGKAEAALGSFEAYKRRGGPLLEEAHWGSVRALHLLGRAQARDRAIDALDARFPSSAYRAQAAELQEER